MKVAYIALIALLCSCATTRYETSGKIPTFIGPSPGHNKFKKATDRLDFYLWGMFPRHHVVYIDKEFDKSGLVSVSKVEIKEDQTTMDKFISFITLGMYTPKYFELSGWGKVDQ